MNLNIRLEEEKDHRRVEEITREAFWNLYMPGCDEHLIVHKMRKSPDFIPQLCYVVEKDHEVVGSIVYSKSKIVDETNNEHEVITIGPVSVLPELHGNGIGAALINHTKKVAKDLGFKAIVIYGYPSYYNRLGFESAAKFGISRSDGEFAKALLAYELYEGALTGIKGKSIQSSCFETNEDELQVFDQTFAPKEKQVTKSQEEFEVMANLLEN